MWICALEYVLEQFSDELAEESADPCDRATAMHCEQSYIKSVNATVTTTADAAAAAAVCMETSFGLESDEPRTHIFHSTQSEHQLSLQLVPGSLIGCFSCGLRQWFSNFFDHGPLFPQVQFADPRTCYSKIYTTSTKYPNSCAHRFLQMYQHHQLRTNYNGWQAMLV